MVSCAAVLCIGAAAAQDSWDDPGEAGSLGAAAAGVEQSVWVFVLDRELAVSAGTIERIEGGVVEIRDGEDGLVSFGPGEWVAVYGAERGARAGDGPGGLSVDGGKGRVHPARVSRRLRLGSGPMGMAVRSDGVWLPGVPVAGEGEAGDGLWWEHPRFGVMEISLDDLRLVSFPDGPSARALDEALGEPLDDLMILKNSDRLRGFVESIGSRVAFDGPDGLVEVDAGVVGAVALANPSEQRTGAFVWLDDGTVAGVGALEVREGVVRVGLGDGASAGYAGSRWLAGCVSEASELRGLAGVAPVSQAGAGDRHRTLSIEAQDHPLDAALSSGSVLGVRDVRLPGPMEVTWELPDGTTWFATSAMLEHSSSAWADCEFVVSVDGAEVVRERLHAGQPVVGVRVPVEGRTLVVRVEAGANGPVHDQVVLHRPVLLVE